MMRRFASFCCAAALVVVGCGKSDNQTTTDTSAGTVAATATPAPPAGLKLADVAGRWNMRAVPESGPDTTPTNYVLTATADTTGWTITFPNRPTPVAVHVMVAGDSVVTKSGTYESVRRKGVQVMTESVARLQNGKLVGTTVAHYKTTKADSVLRLRVEGTKAP
jgi:hypothetical protein